MGRSCRGGGKLDQLTHVHRREPLRVAVDLRRVDVDHLPGLCQVRFGVRPDLVFGEHLTSFGLPRRIPDPGGEVPDDQHRHVAGILELPELP